MSASSDALTRLKIYPILDELKACLCSKLAADGDFCFCGILMGEDIPLEYAGNCESVGAAYVRISNAFPSTNFPEIDQIDHDPALRAWTIFVGIIRHAPYGEGLEPPDPDDVAQFNLDVLGDAQILWETISCCLNGDKFERIDPQKLRGLYTPIAVQGGVGGGEWQLTLQDW